MCPRMKDGVCEIVGVAPEHIECVDKNLCVKMPISPARSI